MHFSQVMNEDKTFDNLVHDEEDVRWIPLSYRLVTDTGPIAEIRETSAVYIVVKGYVAKLHINEIQSTVVFVPPKLK